MSAVIKRNKKELTIHFNLCGASHTEILINQHLMFLSITMATNE